jgi:hypothetical protein
VTNEVCLLSITDCSNHEQDGPGYPNQERYQEECALALRVGLSSLALGTPRSNRAPPDEDVSDGNRHPGHHDPVLVGLTLNAAPSVEAGGPYSVVEGSSVLVSAVGSDPDDDLLTYAWDLDNDGTYETAGESATFSAAGLEAPATRTIGVQVTDPSGLTATDTAVVNVVWDFSGFFPPIDNPPALNAVKAGRVVAI